MGRRPGDHHFLWGEADEALLRRLALKYPLADIPKLTRKYNREATNKRSESGISGKLTVLGLRGE